MHEQQQAFQKNVSFYISVVCNVLEGMLAGFNFIVLYHSIEVLMTERLTSHLLYRTVFLLIVIFLVRLVVYAYGYTRGQIGGAAVSRSLRLALGDKMRRIPLSFFSKTQAGEYINTATASVNSYENVLTHKIGDIIKNISFTLLLTGFIATVYIPAGAVIFCAGLLLIPSLYYSFLMVNKYGNRKQEIMSASTSAVVEYINGIQTLRAYGLGGGKHRATTASMKAYSDISYTYEVKIIPIGAVFSMLSWLSLPVVLYLAGAQWMEGNLAGPSFVLVAIAPLFTNKLFGTLFIDLTSYKNLMISKKQIEHIFAAPEEPASEREFVPEDYSITFKNVDFSYQKGEQVLYGINISIESGAFTAIVGPSGSGKSTVLNLISKYYEPDHGQICIGKQDIGKLDSEKVLQAVSMVDQEVFLFNDTVLNNIRYAKPEASEQEVMAAAKEANCHTFIEQLEQGYDTMAGDNGNKFSGGERQRISIARAILKDSSILLLDEATSSLDIENEWAVKEATQHLLNKQKTVVMIAHTLSVIKHADKIVVMDGGRVAEEGTHQQLLEKEGRYAAMWRTEYKLNSM
ncbi:ABC transporter ATP-binding protein [Paenibacillus sp. GM2]|uniref:ABC transporter ATP-binding protein n=1 Tax=Paenibacillus sp. GM2 TaxID=1622070 RepID=UPI0008381B04|nr:ABC transporter ATP-binding protein [Paenibacillus sp. GM2]